MGYKKEWLVSLADEAGLPTEGKKIDLAMRLAEY
jgi:hypothetical protein